MAEGNGTKGGGSVDIRVHSEIGRLRAVVMQPPGRGIERCTPKNVGSLSWDAVPSPKKAAEEHRKFVNALRDFGTRVYLFEDLLRETLAVPQARREITDGLLATERDYLSPQTLEVLGEHLDGLSPERFIDQIFFGMTKEELARRTDEVALVDLAKGDPWCLFPMSNILYTRDPAVVLGRGLLFGTMSNRDRMKEPLCYRAIFTHHPQLADAARPVWYGRDREDRTPAEGGNIHCYNRNVFVIGVNDRTHPESIEKIARRTMEDGEITDILVLMFENPRMSSADPMGLYLHVDMFLNMIDHDVFLFYPYIERHLTVFRVTRGRGGRLRIHREDGLFESIRKVLKLQSVRVIKVGGEESEEVAFAEQRAGSGGNTVTLEPGVVCIWDRNEKTIKALELGGIRVVPIEADELVKGGGGPRCSTMPLWREDL